MNSPKSFQSMEEVRPTPQVPFVTKLIRYGKIVMARVWSVIDRPLRKFAAKTRFTAQLYYLFASSAFRRECYATLVGRVRFDDEHRELRASYPLLRRNIHRIEKGIIMKPRRRVFAAGYIQETVNLYSSLLYHERNSPEGRNPELKWARDVLRKFFDLTDLDEKTDAARNIFNQTDHERSDQPVEQIPYKRALEQPPSVTFEDFLALCQRRRSVRWFNGKPVPRELLDRAVLAASESPTACNRQPFSFRFFDEPDLIARASKIPMGTAGFEHNFPVFGVILGELSNYTDERDRHLIYIDGSLAAMSFCLAAETQGLSTCLINWPDIESRERRMEELLGTRADQRVVMCFAVGYPDPDGLVPRSTKKPLELLRSYNALKS